MRTRKRALVCGLGVSLPMLGAIYACTSDGNPSTGSGDDGGLGNDSAAPASDSGSPSNDGGNDGGGDGAPGRDSGPGVDSGPTVDGGADARGADASDSGAAGDSSDGDAGACNLHLPSGYTVVGTSPVDPSYGLWTVAALDENDDPLIAFGGNSASLASGIAPVGCSPASDGGAAGCASVLFTRWDPCAGAFTPPVVVEPTLNYARLNPGDRPIAIAYDKSTHEVGIAYEKTLPTDPGWADTYDVIMLATQKEGASGFSVQQVSDNNRWGSTDVSGAATPTLAMTGGSIYVVWVETFIPYTCPSTQNSCLRVAVSSATNPADAGTPWPGVNQSLDGGVPAHDFGYTHVPSFAGDDAGLANPRSDSLSFAADSNGGVAIAYYQLEPGNGRSILGFYRMGLASSVPVIDATGTQNDQVSANLAFEGTSPRISGHVVTAQYDSGVFPFDMMYANSSDNGATWNPPMAFPESSGVSDYTWLATDNQGDEAILGWFNGNNPFAEDAGCGGGLFVTRTQDGGGSWSGCGLPNSFDYNQAYTANYGVSRVPGKLIVVGGTTPGGGGGFLPDGGGSGTTSAVVYYQDP